MVRWWNIRSATPNGMTINRAWHLRQFLYALLPSAVALISLESAKCWGDLEQHKRRHWVQVPNKKRITLPSKQKHNLQMEALMFSFKHSGGQSFSTKRNLSHYL